MPRITGFVTPWKPRLFTDGGADILRCRRTSAGCTSAGSPATPAESMHPRAARGATPQYQSFRSIRKQP